MFFTKAVSVAIVRKPWTSPASTNYDAVTVLTPLLAQLSEPLRVEMTHGKTPSDWAESLSHYAWPITVLAILLVYREAISKFLRVIGERATEISFGSWASFKLPVLTESPIDQDVAAFKQIEGTQLSESYIKTELFKQFRSADKKEYAIINLGKGREWISSRLFIFAVMLQRMKALKCIVFVSETDQSANRFLGWAPIDSVRWSFARKNPGLRPPLRGPTGRRRLFPTSCRYLSGLLTIKEHLLRNWESRSFAAMSNPFLCPRLPVHLGPTG